jgi:hypothetical protein
VLLYALRLRLRHGPQVHLGVHADPGGLDLQGDQPERLLKHVGVGVHRLDAIAFDGPLPFEQHALADVTIPSRTIRKKYQRRTLYTAERPTLPACHDDIAYEPPEYIVRQGDGLMSAKLRLDISPARYREDEQGTCRRRSEHLPH